MFEVLEPGFQTTVQDVGRQAGQAMGIPPSGAQDTLSLRIANLLVGNDTGGPLMVRESPGAAGLEVLLAGLKLRALDTHLIAVTGADVAPDIDGERVPMWESVVIRAGQVLSFGIARTGVRAYLAVRGGLDVPMTLGSRATHMGGGFGGHEGRKLDAGDRLAVATAPGDPGDLAGRVYAEEMRPVFADPWEVRVIAGPEAHHFTPDSVETFYATDWKLNPKADRTGMRFVGPQLAFRPGRPSYLVEEAGQDPSNIVIDPGAPVGTIQVPSGVEPIVLAVDSPTIGGYARIACVISTDMSRLGQTRPWEIVRFVRVEPDEAVRILERENQKIDEDHVRDPLRT